MRVLVTNTLQTSSLLMLCRSLYSLFFDSVNKLTRPTIQMSVLTESSIVTWKLNLTENGCDYSQTTMELKEIITKNVKL